MKKGHSYFLTKFDNSRIFKVDQCNDSKNKKVKDYLSILLSATLIYETKYRGWLQIFSQSDFEKFYEQKINFSWISVPPPASDFLENIKAVFILLNCMSKLWHYKRIQSTLEEDNTTDLQNIEENNNLEENKRQIYFNW